MSDPITPDALRALADAADDCGKPHGGALRAAADTIEALTAERDELAACVVRQEDRIDEAVALLRVWRRDSRRPCRPLIPGPSGQGERTMSEKPDPRAVDVAAQGIRIANARGAAESAEAALAALESAGWRIVRLEDAGVKPVIQDGERVWEDVYRIIEEGPA